MIRDSNMKGRFLAMRIKRAKRNQTALIKVSIFLLSLSILIIFATMLSSGTIANFNDVEQLQGSVDVIVPTNEEPEEWDKSSLLFDGNEVGFCTPDVNGLFAGITNGGGGDMAGPSTFDVHYHSTKEPNKNNPGDIVYSGEIIPLASGETTILVYEADLTHLQPGHYKFKAYHRPGHGNTDPNGELQVLWSNVITISQNDIDQCMAPQNQTQAVDEMTSEATISTLGGSEDEQ
jgi:YqxM protein